MWDIGRDDSNIGGIISTTFPGDMVISGDKLIAVRKQGSDKSAIIALNRNMGEFIWKWQGTVDLYRKPLIINDKVYIVSYSTGFNIGLIVLNVNNGQIIEQKDYSANYEACTPEQIITYKDNKIYANFRLKDPSTKVIVQIDTEDYSISTLCETPGWMNGRLLVRDNILYIPYSEAKDGSYRYAGVMAYNLDTDTEKWNTDFIEGGEYYNGIYDHNPIIYNDKMYVGVGGGDKVMELNLETGEILRRFSGLGWNGISAGDNTLFMPASLDAYNLETGNLQWNNYDSETMGDIASGSVFYNGVFYYMYCGFCGIDPKSGEFVRPPFEGSAEFSWQKDGTWSMPLLDEEKGIIYINGWYGIYAFKTVK